MAETAYPDGAVTFGYLSNGLPCTAENEAGTVSNRYDRAGRLLETWGVDPGGSVRYGYKPGGQVTNVAHAGGEVAVEYDGAERVTEIRNGADVFAFRFDPDTWRLAACSNGALSVEYGFDAMDRLTNLVWRNATGGVVRSYRYGLNAMGLITNCIRENGESVRYDFDGLDRLVGEERRDASNQLLRSAVVAYDLAGNRVSSVIDGLAET